MAYQLNRLFRNHADSYRLRPRSLPRVTALGSENLKKPHSKASATVTAGRRCSRPSRPAVRAGRFPRPTSLRKRMCLDTGRVLPGHPPHECGSSPECLCAVRPAPRPAGAGAASWRHPETSRNMAAIAFAWLLTRHQANGISAGQSATGLQDHGRVMQVTKGSDLRKRAISKILEISWCHPV